MNKLLITDADYNNLMTKYASGQEKTAGLWDWTKETFNSFKGVPEQARINYDPNKNWFGNVSSQMKFNANKAMLLGGAGLMMGVAKPIYNFVKKEGLPGVLGWAGKNPEQFGRVVNDVSNHISPQLGGVMAVGNQIAQSRFGNQIGGFWNKYVSPAVGKVQQGANAVKDYMFKPHAAPGESAGQMSFDFNK